MSLVPPFLLLDRYDVTEEIGHGGHAIVYRAHDRVLDREVAIKLLREEAFSPGMIARFKQEVQVTAQLEHAHILHVYDTGEYQDRPYIVMELASGKTLAERLKREGQLPLVDALQIARDVGLALAHAHARGVIHRDVKPENILLGDGGAILADFGIARVTQEILTEKITTTGTTVGTVQYMSPEQLCAEPNIDARTDQYSLACVLYEMLAGVRPHVAASFEGLRLLRMTGQHAPVSAHRPSVPGYVDDAIATALAPLPADRFRSMEAFLAGIGVQASGEWSVGGSSDALRAIAGFGGARVNARPSSASRGAATVVAPVRWWTRSRTLGAAGAGTIALAVLTYLALEGNTAASASPSDGSAVFALAASTADSDTSLMRLRSALRGELSAWSGVRVIDDVRRGDTATYAISPEIVRVGDSLRVRINMGRNVAGALTPKAIERVVAARELDAPERFAASVVPLLLLRWLAPTLTESEVPSVEDVPQRSMLGLQEYVLGFVALREGQLDSSMQHFRDAATAAPGFAHAELWAVQIAAWVEPRNPANWPVLISRTARSGSLRGADSIHAAALTAMARMDYPSACESYRALAEVAPQGFAGRFGLGECQRLDSVVIVTSKGARFRTSHWAALESYREAIEIAPTAEILAALFPVVLRTTYAESGRARNGKANDTAGTEYSAMPSLDADTIAFFPVPRVRFAQTQTPSSWTQATRRGRQMADMLTKRWVDRWPTSSSAWYWRALALELAGQLAGDEPSAEDALRRAARDAKTSLDRAHIHVATARVALRLGNVADAVRVARNAVREPAPRDPSARATLAPLAALVGDVEGALRLSLPVAEQSGRYPAGLLDSLEALRVRSAMQDCGSVRSSLDRVNARFDVSFSNSELAMRRSELLLPVLRTSVPCLDPGVLSEFVPGAAIDAAYRALAESRKGDARKLIHSLQSGRKGATPGSITWDHIFAEAWISVQAGDSSSARDQLGKALGAIAEMSPFTLQQLEQAAGLRNGILLFQQLAERQGTALSPVDSAWLQRAAQLK